MATACGARGRGRGCWREEGAGPLAAWPHPRIHTWQVRDSAAPPEWLRVRRLPAVVVIEGGALTATLDEPLGEWREEQARASRVKPREAAWRRGVAPVSYTHLTLPTICSV